MPGAATQVYHQDGLHLHSTIMKPCHAVNVFIPLVDMTKELGGTEFCLGTHILHNEGYNPTTIETPLGPAGVPYIFDYRTGHRGMGNSSEFARPVLYLTYSVDAKFSDKVNFNQRSFHKLGTLLEKPLSREERKKKRNETGEKMAVEAEGEKIAALDNSTVKEEKSATNPTTSSTTSAASSSSIPKKSSAIPKKKRPRPKQDGGKSAGSELKKAKK